jgi:sucrose-6-phosphate hydrolase SacC (GH32 family)
MSIITIIGTTADNDVVVDVRFNGVLIDSIFINEYSKCAIYLDRKNNTWKVKSFDETSIQNDSYNAALNAILNNQVVEFSYDYGIFKFKTLIHHKRIKNGISIKINDLIR